jgi:hypothetical protein
MTQQAGRPFLSEANIMENPKAQTLKRLGKLRVRHFYFKAGDASVKSVGKMND